MRKKHEAAFNTFSSSLKPRTISLWTKMVDDWNVDHSNPNPYEEPASSKLLFCVKFQAGDHLVRSDKFCFDLVVFFHFLYAFDEDPVIF